MVTTLKKRIWTAALAFFGMALSPFAPQANAREQIILDISNDLTKDVVQVSVTNDKNGNLKGFEVGSQSFSVEELQAGAKLVYKDIFLLTAKSAKVDPKNGGAIELICSSGKNKSARVFLERDESGRWVVVSDDGRLVRELKLVIELNWKLKPVGAKDVILVVSDLDPNVLAGNLLNPVGAGDGRITDAQRKHLNGVSAGAPTRSGSGQRAQ